jgi:hypothetical protein
MIPAPRRREILAAVNPRDRLRSAGRIDRWVQRLLRRKHPAPSAPPALLSAYPAALPAQAES